MHGRSTWLFARPGTADSLTADIDPTVDLASTAGRIAGVRNLFKPAPAMKFAAGGLVARARQGDEKPLRDLMRKLAGRVGRREMWADTLSSTDPALLSFENPNIPSGYTYLLQLMAHDMIDSAVSLAEAGAGRSGFANTRYEPLSLDTIYGAGPDNAPHVYEYDRKVRESSGAVPRTRLRLGRIAKADGTTRGCPFRDLARAVPADVDDGALRPEEQIDLNPPWPPQEGGPPQQGGPSQEGAPETSARRPWRTEVLIADVRNDSHALISQLTVLFHILHNHVLGLLGPETGDAVTAYRRFLCARLVVTMIYRSVITSDVMPRILDKKVLERYSAAPIPLLEDAPKYAGDLDAMPLEFSHGAFRFGHAMTRDEYRINAQQPLSFLNGLDQSSVHGPNTLPVTELWHIDWSRFFQTGQQPSNWSVRIGPNSSGPLLNSFLFPPTVPGLDREGVPNRDFVSACYADLWSVPALFAELQTMPGIDAILPDYAVWKQPLRDWLGRFGDDFSPEEIETLVSDPPLPFFVMFEAGHVVKDGVPTRSGGGERLGPLGSLIVAETIFGSLKRNPIGYEAAGDKLTLRIAAVCKAMVGNSSALAAVPDIGSMPELLQFLKNGEAINLPGPV